MAKSKENHLKQWQNVIRNLKFETRTENTEVSLEEECQIHRGAAFEISSLLVDTPYFQVIEHGGTEAAWANIVEAVKKLAAAAPREP